MLDAITPYPLPEAVQEQLLTLADESDLLLIGETHGTQEIPRLILTLLPHLARIGFSSLAQEIPADQRDQLLQWTNGEAAPPPLFGPSDFRDGRGNVQALSLIEQAVSEHWHLLCFDVASMNFGDGWADRDRSMARNLLAQWQQYCPGKKVLGVCGNYHSRLVPPSEETEFWPSFAASVQQMRPDLRVNSINVVFQRGGFFNGEIRNFDIGLEHFAVQAEVRPAGWLGHTFDLYLPRATPATFLEQ
ncbi:MAG: hypothetical protein ACRYFS_18535 [Janthinobacterium lividum]